jgi:hypothetical protein
MYQAIYYDHQSYTYHLRDDDMGWNEFQYQPTFWKRVDDWCEKAQPILTGGWAVPTKKYSKDDIYEMLCLLTHKNRFMLFCHLLISRHCHLVINNLRVLELMKGDLKIFAPLFRYLLGYTFLTLSFDETLKKNVLTNDDPSVFEINTAANLPQFPHCKAMHRFVYTLWI